MADDKFNCPECYLEQSYYDARKRLDPRTKVRKRRLRVLCAGCVEKINQRLKVRKAT